MIKCYKCECKNHAVYESIKEDFIVYCCSDHVIDENMSLSIEYNANKEELLKSLKSLIVKKQSLLEFIKKASDEIRKKAKPTVYVQSKHPSNQFIMIGFVGLRQAAGQKQDRNLAHLLKLTIKALQKYPLPILHPDQALALQGIGPSLTKSLHSIFKTNHIKYKNLKKKQITVIENHEYSSFCIKLYIDQRETRGNNLISLIESLNINYSIKTLALGDYIFVAESSEKAYVLDTIIERKSSNDLNSSHFSNHLRDQVRRLKNCLISNKILLIEGKVNYEILIEM